MNKEERKIKKRLFIEELPKKNYHIGKTCKAIRISRRTFYKWRDEDEEFRNQYLELVESDIDDSEEKMKLLRQGLPEFDEEGRFIGWIERPHFQALAFHLNAKARDRGYGEKMEITGANGGAISFIHLIEAESSYEEFIGEEE